MSRLGNNLVIPTYDSDDLNKVKPNSSLENKREKMIPSEKGTKSILLKIFSVLITIVSIGGIGLILAYMIGNILLYSKLFLEKLTVSI